ncbi:MAG: stage II sporulation protein P, partial [Bacilli bacterium]|nr:stage II sporulation protein P [Bacilli bacterium]
RKIIKFKYLIFISFIYLSFSYTFYNMIKDNNKISNEEFINILVSSGNANIINKYKTTNIVNNTMKYLLKINIKKPETLLNTSILKYGKIKKTVKTISLEYNDDYSNMDDLKKVSDYIKDPNPKKIDNPIIYLYNSHQLENYSNESLDIYGITPNVLMASYLLKEKLNSMNIPTIVEEANMSEILEKNNWNYSYSYNASRELLTEKISKYKTLKYFIDIHRDSITKNYSTIKIDDKSYAKVLFVIGLDHNNWEPNFNLATKFNNIIEKKYPGLSKGIMKKTGMNVNGIYNQDVSPNCILIEIGGVDNTIEEVFNTTNVIAETISTIIKE